MALVKYNNNSISAITSTGLTAGAMTLIKSQTASSSSTISFIDGVSDVDLDATYPIYVFKFINANPNSGAGTCTFQFNGTDDTSSHSFDITKTTTTIQSTHGEGDGYALVRYNTSFDLAQSTAFQSLNFGDSSVDADGSISGELWLFNPSSTTFVKHFISNSNSMASDGSDHDMVGGYFNTTSAITGIQFKFSAGVIESGTFKLYGIKDS